ncbi:beta-N-acetyl-D-glucosaminide beta-1,4-N-acetylglucosaminyl-transferase-like [Biomphalaria glabrata]|uniref:Beta-N-acetyl-D-glucosaminide beta-1,4-N-acetylglucosaminyl-transferase-like n=1 Tax=Biomphalaria glabrata TaxID=6526 RepID=A0A9W2Z1R3_BIOGL|nr:beta-N-acetyl-D-glucosaminide beta-1,4-N-acetylglucosaminyl-transferase-like [Biomphalaria glabrata]XP_055869007.1 beta-N-acetyl-D-glucosaminide beta-1,4-N-acetylglucosaminyl-transferase-like [Biomphalaria glabrata]XP_055869008.1 beta-N-acetyl-D-glucosaminide beta-1,4-N-acetylglucosaminyl-transferase-like [Biomphalaria glabrata]XP_055869009.1 beta-N-acetyl-D-glucosaminide beta-1,4-N-acetylglucosaminyl-transferase-like [Biomphalaria glabrata]
MKMSQSHIKDFIILAMTITVLSLVYNMLYITDDESSILQIKELVPDFKVNLNSEPNNHDRSLKVYNVTFLKDVNVNIPGQTKDIKPKRLKPLDPPPPTIPLKNRVLQPPSSSDNKGSSLASQKLDIGIKKRNNTKKIKTAGEKGKNVKREENSPNISTKIQKGTSKITIEKQGKQVSSVHDNDEDYDPDRPNDFRDGVFDNEIMSLKIEQKRFSLRKDGVTFCPDRPPHLLGSLTGFYNEITKEELQELFPEMESGGRIRPPDCVQKQRMAIIMPYRNRFPHLHIALHNLIPFLKRQQADVTFFVIEQAPGSTFNRGALLNIGFLEAEKLGNFDCYIFHDVDLIPLNDKNLYRCESDPRHYAVAMNKFNFKLFYSGYFGGVVGFSREQFLKVNGNSNLYIGWGGEDDDLLKRLYNKKYTILRHPTTLSRYFMLKHTRDKGNEANPLRMAILNGALKRQDIEGLNTVKYKVINITLDPLYTWINVSINTTEILLTAPAMTLQDVDNAKKKWHKEKMRKEKARLEALQRRNVAKTSTSARNATQIISHDSVNSKVTSKSRAIPSLVESQQRTDAYTNILRNKLPESKVFEPS